MKRRTFTIGLAAGAVTVVSGCGGGSSGGGGVFLKDVSGTWNETGGELDGGILILAQSGDNVSGAFSRNDLAIQFTGEKDGNTLEMSGSVGQVSYTLNQTLVSGSQMSGTFSYSVNGLTAPFPATFTKA